MTHFDVQYVIDCVLRLYPETAQEITTMLNSFDYNQLEEYARVASAILGI